jgi:hypothetical protein
MIMKNTETMTVIDTANRNLYYIGDPCYVLSDTDWDSYCAQYDWKDCNTYNDEDGYDSEIWIAPELGEWEVYLADDGTEPWRPVHTFSTAYGDGCYQDQDGRSYSVDSGGIGCIRVDHANYDKLQEAVSKGLGHIHEFEERPGCGYDSGLIWFEGVEIATA